MWKDSVRDIFRRIATLVTHFTFFNPIMPIHGLYLTGSTSDGILNLSKSFLEQTKKKRVEKAHTQGVKYMNIWLDIESQRIRNVKF